jgi:hypothetical protein
MFIENIRQVLDFEPDGKHRVSRTSPSPGGNSRIILVRHISWQSAIFGVPPFTAVV